MGNKRKLHKCTSSDLGPLGFLIDLAGAATMGAVAKHKIKKDFEQGGGKDSLLAANTVLGRSAMRSGSEGVVGLGGLLGVSSALKDLKRDQVTSRVLAHTGATRVKAKAKRDVPHIWRQFCSDGTSYGLDPMDFDNADDYEDAIEEAKRVLTDQ